MVFAPRPPNFTTLGQGFQVSKQSYMGNREITKTKFMGSPAKYDMIRWISISHSDVAISILQFSFWLNH